MIIFNYKNEKFEISQANSCSKSKVNIAWILQELWAQKNTTPFHQIIDKSGLS